MPSSDPVDPAVALQIRDSLKLIIEDVKMVMESVKKRAFEHKMTLMVGRSPEFMESQSLLDWS